MSASRTLASSRRPQQLLALAVAGARAGMAAPGFAQQNPPAPAPANTVTVTDIRTAMQSTLNLKRNSNAIVWKPSTSPTPPSAPTAVPMPRC